MFTENDVATRLTMGDAIAAVGQSFHRIAAGSARQQPRVQLHFPNGYFAAVCAVDDEIGLSSVKSYSVIDGRLRGMSITLTSLRDGSVLAVIEADLLTRLRTGAASGVAAAQLCASQASSVGIIGCGRQAPFQLDAVRRAVPSLVTARAWCPSPDRLSAFCAATQTTPARSADEVSASDIVVVATTSATPVVHGAALRPGAVVIAIGGDGQGHRELDDEVIARASLVTCDSIAASRTEAADIWEPVDSGLLDWGDVTELHQVISGALPGRINDDDIAVFKSNGLAAWDLATAATLLPELPRMMP